MNSSKYDKFRKDVRDLNAQFEEWIRSRLRMNKSASLQQGIAEYNEKLQGLERESGFCVDDIEKAEIASCPYQLTPQNVTKVVHFIRHGHGFHNPPLFCDHHDARLTALGWKQTFEVRRHILQLKTPFLVEMVVVSPLSRCLETASGIFGYEKVDKDSELLKRERVVSSEGSGPSHPNFYKSKNLPIVAQELCRECLLGNKCDKRRTRHELAQEFPGVDFSKLDYDEDLLGQTVTEEWGDKARKRAQSFVKWLMNRSQSHIAVISHCSFLAFLMQECCTHLKGMVAIRSTELFRNCELRTLVLSRVDTSTVKSYPKGTGFRPDDP